MKKSVVAAVSLIVAKTAMWSIIMTKKSLRTRHASKKGSLWAV